jgi:hypothetical protein
MHGLPFLIAASADRLLIPEVGAGENRAAGPPLVSSAAMEAPSATSAM